MELTMTLTTASSPEKEQFDICVSPELKERLDKYAALAGHSKATIAANALSDYLD
jgi:predicted transcriptional regulator